MKIQKTNMIGLGSYVNYEQIFILGGINTMTFEIYEKNINVILNSLTLSNNFGIADNNGILSLDKIKVKLRR